MTNYGPKTAIGKVIVYGITLVTAISMSCTLALGQTNYSFPPEPQPTAIPRQACPTNFKVYLTEETRGWGMNDLRAQYKTNMSDLEWSLLQQEIIRRNNGSPAMQNGIIQDRSDIGAWLDMPYFPDSNGKCN